MGRRISHFAVAAACGVALGLFWLGLSYPLPLRVRGDAYVYLLIANGFQDLGAALSFLGDRTAGMPLFDFLVRRAAGLVADTHEVLPWVNAICATLLAIHIATSWFFAGWIRTSGHIRSAGARHALFFFLATYPALIGYTTTPLSDTLAIDLILLGCAVLARAGQAASLARAATIGLAAGALLGFSVLVRSGSMPGMLAGMVIAFAVAYWHGRIWRMALAAAALGALLVVAPYFGTCMSQHGRLCLQYPAFDPLPSAQAGLRGARTVWSLPAQTPDGIPTLADPVMLENFGERCELTRLGGIHTNSLTGCLLSRPLAIPAFLFKKWVGLLDHHNFHSYLENDTPRWLQLMGRLYASLAWVGFVFAFAAAFQIARRNNDLKPERLAAAQPAMALLVSYSAVTLAVHTLLHVEDRYGFAWLPLCAVVLVAYAESGLQRWRTDRWRRVTRPLTFALLSVAAFLVQVIAWDQALP